MGLKQGNHVDLSPKKRKGTIQVQDREKREITQQSRIEGRIY